MIETLIAITDELIDLLKTEHVFLKGRQLAQAGELHERKESLNEDYHMVVKQLDSIESLSEEKRSRLYLKTTEMKHLIEENKKLLDVVTTVNDRLLQALVAQFLSKAPAIESYSRLGAHLKGRFAKTAPLTVSKGA